MYIKRNHNPLCTADITLFLSGGLSMKIMLFNHIENFNLNGDILLILSIIMLIIFKGGGDK